MTLNRTIAYTGDDLIEIAKVVKRIVRQGERMTDTETGLPELPEGYFWRVVEGASHITYVELRKKAWLGSRRVDRRPCRYYDMHHNVLDPRDEILSRAHRIVKEFHDPRTEFYGDYPPKSLLGSKTNAAEDAADKEEE